MNRTVWTDHCFTVPFDEILEDRPIGPTDFGQSRQQAPLLVAEVGQGREQEKVFIAKSAGGGSVPIEISSTIISHPAKSVRSRL